jgi:predicted DNA-binding ribbon-helix-helix protein
MGVRRIAEFGLRSEAVSRRGVETGREILRRFDAVHVMIRERRNYEFFELVGVLREERDDLGSLFSVC